MALHSIIQQVLDLFLPKGNIMSVKIKQDAPNFTINDYNGQPVSLADYKYEKNVLLVFNRGFL
jgi:hypothetical protein